MQNELFDQDKKTPDWRIAVLKIKQDGPTLSKEQKSFNRLINRIGNLQKQLQNDTAKMDELHNLYHQKLRPELVELCQLKIQLCHLLDEKRKITKLSHIQGEKLDDLIIYILSDSLNIVEPDEATKQLYEKYNNISYDYIQQNKEEVEKSLFCELFFKKFGIELDPALLTENPDYDKIAASLSQQYEEIEQKSHQKRKSRKQQEKEIMLQQQHELKNKSLRSIYLSLAKLLHPDAEVDITLKHEKEELMKQVTKAYNDRDMIRLLQLEMQWVNTHDEELSKMNTDTLTVYLQLLKDQVKDLEAQREMLIYSPKYGVVAHYFYAGIVEAKANILMEAREIQKLNEEVKYDIATLQKGNKNYSVIRDCLEKY